jgi:diaminohydroxyphosphoribosylaminopyrimidine deaminase/5-amino-6-(5-phosphoribosylamino)uracil reductase
MEDSLGNPWLLETIALAKAADPNAVRPNPRVGALVLNAEDQVVGRGFHPALGQSHAEVFAIREALHNGAQLEKCRLFVSLEPCSHVGRTPACCQLILEHKIPEVWVASKDPNPKVNGLELLQKNGVVVHYSPLKEALELNKEFWVNQIQQRPYVKLKMAESSNGFVTAQEGKGTPISCADSRHHAHQHLRCRVDAILTSAKTVLIDNPLLNIRLGQESRELSAVVIDRKGSLLKHPHLRLFYPRSQSRILLVTDLNTEEAELPPAVEILRLAFVNGRAPLKELLQALWTRFEWAALLVESGPELAQSLLSENLVDEVHLYRSPRAVSPSIAVPNFSRNLLAPCQIIASEQVGEDLYQCFDFQPYKPT